MRRRKRVLVWQMPLYFRPLGTKISHPIAMKMTLNTSRKRMPRQAARASGSAFLLDDLEWMVSWPWAVLVA